MKKATQQNSARKPGFIFIIFIMLVKGKYLTLIQGFIQPFTAVCSSSFIKVLSAATFRNLIATFARQIERRYYKTAITLNNGNIICLSIYGVKQKAITM